MFQLQLNQFFFKKTRKVYNFFYNFCCWIINFFIYFIEIVRKEELCRVKREKTRRKERERGERKRIFWVCLRWLTTTTVTDSVLFCEDKVCLISFNTHNDFFFEWMSVKRINNITIGNKWEINKVEEKLRESASVDSFIGRFGLTLLLLMNSISSFLFYININNRKRNTRKKKHLSCGYQILKSRIIFLLFSI